MNIKRKISSLMIVCGSAVTGIVLAGTAQINDYCKFEKDEAKCKCYQSQADYYEEEMRKGYAANQYDNLEANRKYFKDKAFNCKDR